MVVERRGGELAGLHRRWRTDYSRGPEENKWPPPVYTLTHFFTIMHIHIYKELYTGYTNLHITQMTYGHIWTPHKEHHTEVLTLRLKTIAKELWCRAAKKSVGLNQCVNVIGPTRAPSKLDQSTNVFQVSLTQRKQAEVSLAQGSTGWWWDGGGGDQRQRLVEWGGWGLVTGELCWSLDSETKWKRQV